jgi:hypothetical protein
MLQRRQRAATTQYMYFERLQGFYILKSSNESSSNTTSSP